MTSQDGEDTQEEVSNHCAALIRCNPRSALWCLVAVQDLYMMDLLQGFHRTSTPAVRCPGPAITLLCGMNVGDTCSVSTFGFPGVVI